MPPLTPRPPLARPTALVMKADMVVPIVAGLLAAVIMLRAEPATSMPGQFGLEFAIDAPWRLEPIPTPGAANSYGPIPITIAFHDAIFDHHRSSVLNWLANNVASIPLEQRHVGVLQYIDIREGSSSGTRSSRFYPGNLREIERKRWISTRAQEPPHELCNPQPGRDCRALYDITDSHEWHAMMWYTPIAPVTAGRNINLIVTVVTQYGTKDRQWTSNLVVHAGESPLPRFSNRWLYGDLHYHSQMTDNEGESAYSYRNVVRTLGALGMDFVFATDHASDSEQIDGGIGVTRCGSATGPACVLPPGIQQVAGACKINGAPKVCRQYGGTEARDLNQPRFAAAKWIIYARDGANEAVARDATTGGLARYRSSGVLPQVYMGEEVDAWPEMSAGEYQSGLIAYGDRLTYAWPDVSGCLKLTSLQFCQMRFQGQLGPCLTKPIGQLCRERYSTVQTTPAGSRFLTQDNQGIPHLDIQPEPSRQHMVYLPHSGAPDGTGFVSSRTRKYGGASRQLDEVLRQIETSGVTFLAHPLVGSRPGGREGPDIVPYSETALNIAWSSPAVLGLQFWNENDHVFSKVGTGTPRVRETELQGGGKSYAFTMPFAGPWSANGDPAQPWTWKSRFPDPRPTVTELYQGAITWDRYLRKGLQPSETGRLQWLAPGEPRKWFMAGGSDSHGDFNYRRYGNVCDQEWCDERVGDTGIGRPRNLVFGGIPAGQAVPALPTAKRYTNRQVIEGLRSGRFSVTDGPALRIAIDRNRDKRIDDADFQMGATFNLFPGEHVPLLVEWFTTAEFGPVSKVDVYVGTPPGTYAAAGHGPVAGRATAYTADPTPNGVLRVTLDAQQAARRHGIAEIFLSPEQFRLLFPNQLFYVRAYAETNDSECPPLQNAGNSCGQRLAYSNPIWGRYHASCPAKPIPHTGGARTTLDADNNGVADVCERDIPDPCPAVAAPPGRRPAGLLGNVLVRPGPAVDPGAPAGPAPKVAPATSCQIVRSLVLPAADLPVRPPIKVQP